MRVLVRLREALSDDSANVRWYLVYTLGTLGSYFPSQSRAFLNDLVVRLDDQNRVVRSLSCKALSQVAARKPLVVEEFFQNLKREIPPPIARVLHSSKKQKSEFRSQ